MPSREVWLRAKYLRAVAYLNSGKPGDLQKAAADVKELRKALDPEKAPEAAEVAAFERRLKRHADLLRLSIKLERGRELDDPTPDEEWEREGGYYNLACFYSRKGRIRIEKSEAEEGRKVARSRRNVTQGRMALVDAKLRRKQAKRAAKKVRGRERQRADAALAEAKARVSAARRDLVASERVLAEGEAAWDVEFEKAQKTLEQAVAYLSQALARGDEGTAQLAERDQALKPLRDLDSYKKLVSSGREEPKD